MKSTLKLCLAAMLLGLPIAGLLRADDQTAPAQTGPSIQSEPSAPPETGERPQRMRDPQQMLKMLTKRLSLTDDQQAKTLPILQAQLDQLTALRKDTTLSDDEKHKKMREIMQSSHEQIGALLTPEQKEKFKNMRGGRGDHGAHGEANPPPPANNPPPADNPAPPPAT